MPDRPSPDFPEYTPRTAEVWDRLAEWWDDRIGDGNDFQNLLIEPATERLLALRPGERVLDVACGAGRFARRMADAGAVVVAVDHSERFVRRARHRSGGYEDRIAYHVFDASDPASLLSLGPGTPSGAAPSLEQDTSLGTDRPAERHGRFDAAVCTMALMDMAAIGPMIGTLPLLLKPGGGRFVFSVTHPAFNSGSVRRVAEERDTGVELVTTFGVKVTDYATPFTYLGVGVPGQPEPQHYFHRPISLLFDTCFRHGFVLDVMEEPALPEDTWSRFGRPLSFGNTPDLPPVLVARMRLPAQ